VSTSPTVGEARNRAVLLVPPPPPPPQEPSVLPYQKCRSPPARPFPLFPPADSGPAPHGSYPVFFSLPPLVFRTAASLGVSVLLSCSIPTSVLAPWFFFFFFLFLLGSCAHGFLTLLLPRSIFFPRRLHFRAIGPPPLEHALWSLPINGSVSVFWLHLVSAFATPASLPSVLLVYSDCTLAHQGSPPSFSSVANNPSSSLDGPVIFPEMHRRSCRTTCCPFSLPIFAMFRHYHRIAYCCLNLVFCVAIGGRPSGSFFQVLTAFSHSGFRRRTCSLRYFFPPNFPWTP